MAKYLEERQNEVKGVWNEIESVLDKVDEMHDLMIMKEKYTDIHGAPYLQTQQASTEIKQISSIIFPNLSTKRNIWLLRRSEMEY